LWGWFQMMAAQDVAHRNLVDVMPQVGQRSLDASVAPDSILFRHAHDKLLNLLGDTGSAEPLAVLAPVELLRDQSLVPPLEGLGRGDRGDLFEAFGVDWMGQCGETAPFGVGQPPLLVAKFGSKSAIFFDEVGDHVLLVPLNPAGDHGNQDL
jgi:hypothetical protein